MWTGYELLVHGAYFRFEDGKSVGRSVGAAYRPTTRTWRVLPPAPGPLKNMEGGYHAIWTGRQVLIWGGGCCGDDVAGGAAYTPATNRWSSLPATPLAGRQQTPASGPGVS